MQVFDNEFETVIFHEQQQLFEAIWKKASEKMVDEDYKTEVVKQFDFITTQKVKFILFQTLDFCFTIPTEVQTWNNEILVSGCHKAGVEKIAVVIPADIFSEVSIQQTIEDTKSVGFVTQYFKTTEEAIAWFGL